MDRLMKHEIPKGVFDILPENPSPKEKWTESHLWQYVENCARATAHAFCFKEIRTPLFEKTPLFQRSIGEETDIVSKEMYTFEDRGGRSMTLRPEGTASLLRAFIENQLYQATSSHKYYYIGPMFRYERQQAGRYRQHHQFGVEAIGQDAPFQDVEVMDLLFTFLKQLGINNTILKINTLGNKECRDAFRNALKEYLSSFFHELSEESQRRFQKNPLRILDSKDERDKKILQGAPQLSSYLDTSSKKHFEELLLLLEEVDIPYVVDPLLVRGLDYYNKTVFEITSDVLGAQNSLGGGGRYDGLIHELGGPPLPAFGFGAGLERIIQTMIAQKVNLPPSHAPLLFMIALGKDAIPPVFKIVSALRKKQLMVEMDFSEKKLMKAMKRASSLNARFVIVMGEEELKTKEVEIKEMDTGHTKKIPFHEIEPFIQGNKK